MGRPKHSERTAAATTALLAALVSSGRGASTPPAPPVPGVQFIPPLRGDLATDATLPAPIIGPGTWTVTCSITVAGAATVSSMQYRDGKGVVRTVSSPASSWSHVLDGVATGSRVPLFVLANAPPGTVTARTVAMGSGGSETLTFEDSCGE